MTQQFDPAERALLDQFDVPAPRDDFTASIIAAAHSPAAKAVPIWSRPLRRAPWARRGIVGGAALVLMTTAAAASGWLGERIENLPVISSIATIVPEAVKPKRIAKPVEQPRLVQAPVKVAPVAGAPKPDPKPLPAIVPAPAPVNESAAGSALAETDIRPIRQQARVERITTRMESMLDQRDARRAARGLATDSAKERTALDRLKMAETPQDRRGALREWRAVRMEKLDQINAKRAERGLPPIQPKFKSPFERRCAMLAKMGRTPPMCAKLKAAHAPDSTKTTESVALEIE